MQDHSQLLFNSDHADPGDDTYMRLASIPEAPT